jgi:hypothetical protein
MAIEKRYHAFCDACSCEYFKQTEHAVDLIDALDKSGWTSHNNKDYCPKCWIEIEQLKDSKKSDKPAPIEKPIQVEKTDESKESYVAREYLTEKEVAEIMSISLATLRNHRFSFNR